MGRLLGLLLCLALAAPAFAAQTPEDPFADEIAAFAAADREAPAAPGATLFVGSSSIRRWTSLARDMAPLRILNRGFGGSRIADINARFDLLVARHRPAAIIFYAGDNDLVGQDADATFADLQLFLRAKQRALGEVPVYFLTVKPSPARLALLPEQQRLNGMVAKQAAERDDLYLVDVFSPMLNARGLPDGDLFASDGLHMTDAGYMIWTRAVRSALNLPQKDDHR